MLKKNKNNAIMHRNTSYLKSKNNLIYINIVKKTSMGKWTKNLNIFVEIILTTITFPKGSNQHNNLKKEWNF